MPSIPNIELVDELLKDITEVLSAEHPCTTETFMSSCVLTMVMKLEHDTGHPFPWESFQKVTGEKIRSIQQMSVLCTTPSNQMGQA